MNRDEIEQVPGMAELKNQSGQLRHVRPALLWRNRRCRQQHMRKKKPKTMKRRNTPIQVKSKMGRYRRGMVSKRNKEINGGCKRQVRCRTVEGIS